MTTQHAFLPWQGKYDLLPSEIPFEQQEVATTPIEAEEEFMSPDRAQTMTTADALNPVNRGRIGLRWGALFWLPILLLTLWDAGVTIPSSRDKPYAIAGAAIYTLPMLPVLLLAGRRWAMRGLGNGEWAFLLTAIVQAFIAVFVSLILPVALVSTRMWLIGVHALATWTVSDFNFPLILGLCSAWMLALGAVIEWRVRRVVKRPVQGTGLRRFAAMFISSFGVPLLLCAPVVLMLQYDTRLCRNANAVLSHQIKALAPQIADLKDLERVKANLLQRKIIVEHLQTTVPADVLAIFGRLPIGVQLIWLEMKGNHLALALRAEASAEPAVLELLAQHGYRDPHVAARQEDDDAIERVSIEADSTRGKGERK